MVAAVPQHFVAAHVQLPTAACSTPVGDTVVAARQNTLVSFWQPLSLYFKVILHSYLTPFRKEVFFMFEQLTTVAPLCNCGMMLSSWHCITNRKVTGSIPDGDNGIFHRHNPMALALTQPLAAMSTRNISWV